MFFKKHSFSFEDMVNLGYGGESGSNYIQFIYALNPDQRYADSDIFSNSVFKYYLEYFHDKVHLKIWQGLGSRTFTHTKLVGTN